MVNNLETLLSNNPNSKVKLLREEEEKMDEEKLKNDIKAVDTLSRYEEDDKLSNKAVDLSDMFVKHVQHKPILFSDLPEDLIAEILSRVHITSLRSVRSTCKRLNVLSKNRIIGKVAQAKNQFLGFMLLDLTIFAFRIDLQQIRYDFNNLSFKQVSGPNQIRLSKVNHCDGLLLCVLHDNSGLLVWNPYLGQRRWILRDIFNRNNMFAPGYDNNRNHKILEIFVLSEGFFFYDNVFGFNIYEFSSNSWRNIDVPPNRNIRPYANHVSLKGNAYFVALEGIHMNRFLLCFDFTLERFGPCLCMPFRSFPNDDDVVLSCVRDEQLAVLHQSNVMEIWITSKIDFNEVWWTKCMTVRLTSIRLDPFRGSIFIDEEKKVAVVFGLSENSYPTAHIIGQDGSSKSINVGVASWLQWLKRPTVIEYFPSLVQIE